MVQLYGYQFIYCPPVPLLPLLPPSPPSSLMQRQKPVEWKPDPPAQRGGGGDAREQPVNRSVSEEQEEKELYTVLAAQSFVQRHNVWTGEVFHFCAQSYNKKAPKIGTKMESWLSYIAGYFSDQVFFFTSATTLLHILLRVLISILPKLETYQVVMQKKSVSLWGFFLPDI